MAELKDPKHPIWKIVYILVVMGIATVLAWANASNFDETEFKYLGQLLLGLIGVDVVRSKLSA